MARLKGDLRTKLENILDEISHGSLPLASSAPKAIQGRSTLQVEFKDTVMDKVDQLLTNGQWKMERLND